MGNPRALLQLGTPTTSAPGLTGLAAAHICAGTDWAHLDRLLLAAHALFRLGDERLEALALGRRAREVGVAREHGVVHPLELLLKRKMGHGIDAEEGTVSQGRAQSLSAARTHSHA